MSTIKPSSLVQAFITILILGVVGVGLWYFMTHNPKGVIRTEVRDAFAAQYQGVAGQYKRRMGDYGGMCVELAAVEGVFCQSSEEAYRIYKLTPTNKFFCTDSTGFEGAVDALPNQAPLCQ